MYIYKVNSSDGAVQKKFLLREDTPVSRAILEDPEGGYIIGTGDAEFIEGGRYPAITQIIKLDENLDSIIWKLPLSETQSFNIFWHLEKFISLGNNEFLGIGVADMTTPFSHLGRIVKFTGDGELIFDKEIYNVESTPDLEQRLVDVVPYKDGFVAVGTLLALSNLSLIHI